MSICPMAAESKVHGGLNTYAEPDHIFVRPLPNLAQGDEPATFPFVCIKPTENEKVLRKLFPEEKGHVSKIDPIGNSPVIIKKCGRLAGLNCKNGIELEQVS